jgi:hypothetical protein
VTPVGKEKIRTRAAFRDSMSAASPPASSLKKDRVSDAEKVENRLLARAAQNAAFVF